jgi:hypothetical protein
MGTSEFGLFMHEYLTAAFPSGLPATVEAPTGESWKARMDRHVERLAQRLHTLPPDQRIHEVLRSEVLYHELRHLHDAFGTCWGIRLFTRYMKLMQQFVTLLEDLRSLDTCSLPLFQWSERPEAPDMVKAFIEAYRAYNREQQIVRCAFDLPWQEGPAPDADFVVLDIEDLGVQVPAFAVTADRIVINEDGDVSSVTPGHKIVPIGLEVILEGIARQIQNFRVHTRYGQEVLELIEERLRTHPLLDAHEASDIPLLPYAISDFMYSKIFARRGFTHGDFAGGILAASDYALMPLHHDLDDDLGTDAAARSMHPGWRFVEVLQTAQLLNNPPRFVVATPPAHHWAGLLRKHCEAGYATGAPAGFPDYVEWQTFRNFVIPLLRVREEVGDRAFIDPGTYVGLSSRLPQPEFVLIDGGLIRFSKGSSQSPRSWVAWAILDQVMLDMVDSKVAYCPRYHRSKLHPYLKGTSLNAPPVDCEEELPKGCGWFGFDGDISHLPACEFRRFIQGFKLHEREFRDA